jgi:hypothetical protein
MRSILVILLSFFAYHSIAQQQQNFTVYFDRDKAVPTIESGDALMKFIARFPQSTITHISLSGYADQSGEEYYNMGLSERRVYVVRHLLEKLLPGVVIDTAYYGEQFLVSEQEPYKNRRVELVLTTSQGPIVEEDISLKPFYIDAETQVFDINLDDTVFIKGKEGTSIKIPPGSILRKDSSLMHGRAMFQLKEYYKPSVILMAGMHTSSDEGLLQTGGMIRVYIIQDKDTASYYTRKEVEIRMPKNNPLLTNMNVYVQPHTDSSEWINAKRSFRESMSYWNWPRDKKFVDMHLDKDFRYENWKTGRKTSEDYFVRGPLISFRIERPYTKKVTISIEKKDSLTLAVQASFKYRRKALRLIGIRSLDTSFNVNYVTEQYIAWVDYLNLINCDRFWDRPNRTDFIVKTPGFKGMNVLVYFKKLNAFMNAARSGNQYFFKNIPEGEEVYLLAFGKKDEEYYYGQQPYIIAKQGQVNLNLTKVAALEECKTKISALVE